MDDKEKCEEWMDRFTQRDHAREVAEANTGHELAVALIAAKYANIEGLEEYEIRLEQWKYEQEHEEANREEAKRQMAAILLRGMQVDTIDALTEAIDTVNTKFGKTSMMVIGSHQYKLCSVRLQQLLYGAKTT